MNMSFAHERTRPFNPEAVERLRGKYKDLPGPSSDEVRRLEREEETERELSINGYRPVDQSAS
jgi:hypothetical protein